MDSSLWGQLSCLSKERRREGQKQEKKSLSGQQRDAQLQRGAGISFYTLASFFARVERLNEWYHLPGGIGMGKEYLQI